MRTLYCMILMVACCVASGCAVSGPKLHPVTTGASGGAHSFGMLLADLNDSKQANAQARAELVALGEASLPHLLWDIDLRNADYLDDKRLDRATRALRVVREMRSPVAIEACHWLLLEAEIDVNGISTDALYSEAIGYLGDQFDQREARETYLEFVRDCPEKYIIGTFVKKHWRAGRRVDLLRVDVLCNVLLLSDNHDETFKSKEHDAMFEDVLIALVGEMAQPTYGGSAVHRLGKNGFTLKVDPRDARGIESLLLLFTKEGPVAGPADEAVMRP
jgi:hypothetical protein